MTRRTNRRDEPDHVLRLAEPDDLLRVIPYLVGFHPADSLVLVALSEGLAPGRRPRICVTARLDLADVRRPGAVVSAVTAAAQAGARAALLAIYCPTLGAAVDHLGDAAEVTGVLAAFDVEVASWFFHGADAWAMARPDSGPGSEGDVVFRGPFEHQPDSTVAAEATFAGLVARPDRASLAQLLVPEPAERRDALRAALSRAVRNRRDCGEAVRARCQRSDIRALFSASRSLPLLEAGQIVRFGAALADPAVRDACWLAIESSRIDGEGLWRELSRRLPDEFRAAPLFLLGWQEWRRGNGALASIAAEEAYRCDPAYSAAELLIGALQHGLDPRRTPRLRKGA